MQGRGSMETRLHSRHLAKCHRDGLLDVLDERAVRLDAGDWRIQVQGDAQVALLAVHKHLAWVKVLRGPENGTLFLMFTELLLRRGCWT